MKRIVMIGAAVALAACGNKGTSTKMGTYFVPRASLPALGSDAKVVGTHDSGLLVQSSTDSEADLLAKAPQSFRFDQWAPEYTAYDFDSMSQKVQELAKTYPNLVKVDTYATSSEGRAEYVMTLDDKTQTGPKTELMITAATHGNEVATVDVVLGLTELLLKGQGTDQRLTDMLKKHTIYIVPAVCADSYVAQTREAEGVDPNREYPYPEDQSRTPGAKCIRDVMAFVDSHNIVGTLDYHDAASMVFFPWAYTYDQIPTADYQKLDALTTKMASANGFQHGQIAQTIYIAPGSSADYYYWKHHAASTAIELSHDYASKGRHYDDLLDESTESTWSFIEGAQL